MLQEVARCERGEGQLIRDLDQLLGRARDVLGKVGSQMGEMLLLVAVRLAARVGRYGTRHHDRGDAALRVQVAILDEGEIAGKSKADRPAHGEAGDRGREQRDVAGMNVQAGPGGEQRARGPEGAGAPDVDR